MIKWIFSDGGRKAAGFKGETRDCVARAIAIAHPMEYQSAYALVNAFCSTDKKVVDKGKNSARTGVEKKYTHGVLQFLEWKWNPMMGIGTGCKVHLRADQLPSGTLIVQLSRHVAAVIDGRLYDTEDCSRGGTRCVYGYWTR